MNHLALKPPSNQAPGANSIDAVVDPSASNPVGAAGCFDTTPEKVLATLSTWNGPVLVDLDETLYLRNSTEDFLDSARPGLLALLLLKLLDVAKPWRLTGGQATRDAWRVQLVKTLLPWTALLWRRRVAMLARDFTNRPLFDALAARTTPPVVATLGFRSIVEPLVGAMGMETGPARLVAVEGRGFADRRPGKLALVQRALGDLVVRRALVVTDSSTDDLPLLAACASPQRTLWPGAVFRRALLGVYFPGEYVSHVKRPGQHYIRRGILQDDFAYWVLSSIAMAAVPWHHLAGLALLLFSFWTIYERGYVDNDRIAARHERDPKLSDEFHGALVATPAVLPWVWASAVGAAGVIVLRLPLAPRPFDLVKWAAVLVATHLWFKMYNRLDKESRVWPYAGLQFLRAASFAVLVPVLPVGSMALAAHVLSRWVPYYIYRYSSGWPEGRPYTTQLLFFLVPAFLVAITPGRFLLFNWTTVALVAWGVIRARKELLAMLAALSAVSSVSSVTSVASVASVARPVRDAAR